MEEIENRFEIIRIAVELGDDETIEVQMERLRNFSTDERLHTILQELENKNFRQALFAMQKYLAEPQEDFFTPEASSSSEELFDMSSAYAVPNDERTLGLDEMLKMTKESASAPRAYTQEPTPDLSEEASSPAVESDKADGVPDAPEAAATDPLFTLDQEIPEDAASFALDQKDAERAPEPVSASKIGETDANEPQGEQGLFDPDPLLDHDDSEETDRVDAASDDEGDVLEGNQTKERYFVPPAYPDGQDEVDLPDEVDHEPLLDEPQGDDDLAPIDHETPEETLAAPEDEAHEEHHYAAFAYMGQKFRNMLHQYPQVETGEEGVCEEAEAFIEHVSANDYTETQIETTIARYQELKSQNHIAHAAQMLIAAATTESTFAQFMLARELFNGDVLLQDYPEAFTQINRLAEEDYPEAICDLGQLYEYGIGIDKNKRHALLLYEEAAGLGIARAKKHHDRLKGTHPIQSIKSLTASLLRKKK